jgi:hypothetical protein
VNSGAPKLTISIDVELAMDPRKYTSSGQEIPTEREIIVKEQLLKHEFVTNNLNIQKCNTSLECHMEKDAMMKQDSLHVRNAKIEMIQLISLNIICIQFGMRLKMTGPSKWIQVEKRFLGLIDLTNC